MYPLDFEEFCRAQGVSDRVFHHLKMAYDEARPVDEVIHTQMMSLFRLYLVVGGMPSVVQRYLDTNNIQEVVREQQNIVNMYEADITKYDLEHKLYIRHIFDLIPGELSNGNKRFIMKRMNEKARFSQLENSFLWLADAGVALPTYAANEPQYPLRLSMSRNLFKLFLADVGLLSSMYMNGIQLRILNGEQDLNFCAVYENFAAQELTAHEFPLYYYNSKKHGELDFLVEWEGKVLPLEIKSGKNYKRHAALSNIMTGSEYDIPKAIANCSHNLRSAGKRSPTCI